jgi:TrmH family RNA methyltransferase
MISSLANDRVKTIRGLQERRRNREREGRFVLEGVRLLEEVLQAGIPPELILHTEEASKDERIERLLNGLQRLGGEQVLVSDEVMEACSDTETPQGILAVMPIPSLTPVDQPTLILIIDRVRDPGNLGTMLRTAQAAGVDWVVLAPETVDATNPKVVRAAMGAHLNLPIASHDWSQIRQDVAGTTIWATAPQGGTLYTAADLAKPTSLIIGGEAMGVSKHSRDLAQGRLRIPMAQPTESLNTSIAAAVVLYEVVRQRCSGVDDSALDKAKVRLHNRDN